MPPLKCIIHGQDTIPGEIDIEKHLQGMDQGTITYRDCRTVDQFVIGGAAPFYPGLRIQDTRSRYTPGGFWDIVLHVRGLLTGGDRTIGRRWRTSAGGFDECVERHVTLRSVGQLGKGTTMSGFPFMHVMEGAVDEQMDGIWEIRDYTFRGISSNKLILRNIGANEQITSPSDPIAVNLPHGWGDPRKSSVSLPRVTVEDTITGLTPPPTDALPGVFFPPNAPAVATITLSGTNLTWNWPPGWKLNSTPGTELYMGSGIWTYKLSYEWVYPAVF